MYGVYDLKNYEMCVGIFDTTQQVADFFHTSRNTICSDNLTRKKLRNKRYQIIKIGETNEI